MANVDRITVDASGAVSASKSISWIFSSDSEYGKLAESDLRLNMFSISMPASFSIKNTTATIARRSIRYSKIKKTIEKKPEWPKFEKSNKFLSQFQNQFQNLSHKDGWFSLSLY